MQATSLNGYIMNKLHIATNTLFAIFCASIIHKASYAEPANLSTLKTEIIHYHDTGLYEKELSRVIKKADDYITQRVRVNQRATHPKKLAIVLDIDETSLSSYDYIVKQDFAFHHDAWHQHILAADAAVIKPTLRLYNNAKKNQVAVFFITGRSPKEKATTEHNLKQAGFTQWSHIYYRPNHHTSVTAFKSSTRAYITKQGYTIIASIGDQYSDLNGGFAEKGFKLPNPYYYLP